MTDAFGNELEVAGECSACGAPATRPKGTNWGPTLVHAPGCTRTGVPFGGHQDTRNVIEMSKARDAAQVGAQEHRLRNPDPLRKTP